MSPPLSPKKDAFIFKYHKMTLPNAWVQTFLLTINVNIVKERHKLFSCGLQYNYDM